MPSLKSTIITASILATAAVTQAATYVGNQNSVYARFDVNWSHREEATLKVTVKDTDDDKHEVYGAYQVYRDGKGGDWEKVRNDNGYNQELVRKTIKLYGEGKKITGVRVKACVDDNGFSDTCHKSKFIEYKA